MTNTVRLPRWFLLPISLWMALQLGRLIAIPLIQGVLAQHESPVWFFPALIDVVVAAATPVMIFLIWRTRTPQIWLACWTYFVVSIFDHASAITATILAGPPLVFVAMFHMPPDAHMQGILQGPGGQAVIDIVFMVLLANRKVRAGFGPR